jgi:hypothetical protein
VAHENTAFQSSRHGRRWLRLTVGLTLLLLGGAACGTTSPSSSPAKAAARSEQASAASPGAQSIASRTNPSSEQVADVIAEVKKRMPPSFLPNEGHVRAFGDAACTAFDEGKTAPQVRALVMQAASQVPSVAVSPADADFAVGTAVHLFCPGYSARLAS